MPSVRGTKTETNLMLAFAGESQARNRYTYYASKAKKEGFEQIAAAFLETAQQESEHAKRFFMFLESGADVEITASFPATGVGTTAANLAAAASGEEHEHKEMYPAFAKVARQEGFEAIAKTFEAIAIAERRHEKRYRALLKLLESGTTFKREASTSWSCRNCGYVHEGHEAPAHCPACAHPQAHFEAMTTIL
jgi:rubrerythrin